MAALQNYTKKPRQMFFIIGQSLVNVLIKLTQSNLERAPLARANLSEFNLTPVAKSGHDTHLSVPAILQ